MEVSYVAAVNFLLFSHWITQRARKGPRVLLPANPVPLYVVAGICGLVGTGMVIAGFFLFQWWLPIVALVIYMFLGAFTLQLQTSLNHPIALYGIVSGLLGLIATGIVVSSL